MKVQPCYPLQEPLGPAAQTINSDPHLGEWGNVQDLHDEGVILLPLKSGDGEEGHKGGRLAMVRGGGHGKDRFGVRREEASQLPVTPQ